jgi:lactate dehydrogenase-like 2-hydroxyacid dehydrogenase
MNSRIFVTRQIPQPAIDALIKAGMNVEVYSEDQVIPRDVLLDKVQNRDGILCILTETIDAEVLRAANQAKIFANYAVGYNNIDMEEATKLGIAITNTPGVLTDATADLTWALILSTARRIVDSDQYLRAGKFTGWGPLFYLGQDITERTLGIIGLGRIGQAVAERAAAFRMKILYTNNNPVDEFETNYPYDIKKVELKELLQQSDIVSVHVPLKPETTHLISHAELALMQPHAILINTARGPIVDESALASALKNNTIWAAGLDVFEKEPEVHPGLIDLPNAVLVPHLGSATNETRTKMGLIAAENLIAFFEGKQPPNLVNPAVWNR